jgi:hypothetical protein
MRQFRRAHKASAPGDTGGGVGTLTAPGPDGPPPEEGQSRRRYDPAWDEWQRPRRWPGVLLTFAIVLGFLGVVVWHYRPRPVRVIPPKAPAVTHPKGLPHAAFIPVGPTVSYHGTHNRTHIAFTSNGHLLVLHARCVCTYNFAISIENAGAVPIAYPVANTGTSDVTLNQSLPAGRYTMSVVASGPWQVQMIRPNASAPLLSTSPKPFFYYSAGPSVIGPFSSTDRHIYMTYLGFGNLYAYILDPSGNRIDAAIAGRFKVEHAKGTAILPDPPDHYYVEVVASTGFWTLTAYHTAKR